MKQESFWIETYTGQKFDYLDIGNNLIDIEDIAHSLSLLCRFNGHCRSFYSVGAHSVNVSYLVDPRHALAALMHDAAEAYISDVPAPLKKMFQHNGWDIEQYEEKILSHIYNVFDISVDTEAREDINRADKEALKAEHDLFFPKNRQLWGGFDRVKNVELKYPTSYPMHSKFIFLQHFEKYRNQKK